MSCNIVFYVYGVLEKCTFLTRNGVIWIWKNVKIILTSIDTNISSSYVTCGLVVGIPSLSQRMNLMDSLPGLLLLGPRERDFS